MISIFYCWKVKAIIIIIILSLRYVFQSGLNGAFTACKWLKSVGKDIMIIILFALLVVSFNLV